MIRLAVRVLHDDIHAVMCCTPCHFSEAVWNGDTKFYRAPTMKRIVDWQLIGAMRA